MYKIKYSRVVGVVVGLLLIVPIVYYIHQLSDQNGKIQVHVDIVPQESKTTVNGKETSSRGTIYLEPGEYTFKADLSEFTGYSKTTYIDKGNTIISVGLTPITDTARKWVNNHTNDYNRIKGLGDTHASEIGRSFNERNPIAKSLPYRTFMYTIGYINDSSDPSENSIILTIYASEGYRQAALYRIRQLGYDPTDFTINFKNYENPFPL